MTLAINSRQTRADNKVIVLYILKLRCDKGIFYECTFWIPNGLKLERRNVLDQADFDKLLPHRRVSGARFFLQI